MMMGCLAERVARLRLQSLGLVPGAAHAAPVDAGRNGVVRWTMSSAPVSSRPGHERAARTACSWGSIPGTVVRPRRIYPSQMGLAPPQHACAAGARRLVVAVTTAAVASALIVADAGAHSGGRAVPVIAAAVRESGPLQALVDVRLRDEDGGEPVRDAVVRGVARMTRPHVMLTYFGPLPEVAPGRYRARVKLPMAARWTVELSVGGAEIVRRSARVEVRIERTALTTRPQRERAPVAAGAAEGGRVLVGAVSFDITRREIQDMVVLWAHGIAATTWIVGLVLLLVSTTAGSGSLLPSQRRALARWHRRVGLPVTWAAAVVVVATGVYNTMRVVPFDLVWHPGDLDRLDSVPYGAAYESILAAKLALFAIMLVTGLRVVHRAQRTWGDPDGDAADGLLLRSASRLGASGAVFVLSAPLLVAAAVALRYVHILSHAAVASGS